ncbi:XRE family transcriptional regulator [Streptomyces sp. NPDC005892]
MGRVPTDAREVVAGLLDDERLVQACARRDMGALFTLLNHRGISTRRIAAAAQITQGRVYDYMGGKSRVEKLAIFEQIADAFHIPGHMLGLAARPWEPYGLKGAEPPLPATTHDDDSDLAALTAFRNADRHIGGGLLYGAVVRHLSGSLGPRLMDVGAGPRIFAVAASMTEMAGWMAHDSGHDDVAARHFARAWAFAQGCGDSALAANVAASRSHLALQGSDPAAAAHWAQRGLDSLGDGSPVPSLVSRLHTMRARALAVSGNFGLASQALDLAHRALDSPTPSSHPGVSPFDAAALASESALVLRDAKRYAQALEYAERAVALRDAERARSMALARIALAGLHVKRADLDAAVSTGDELLDALGPSLGSVRVIQHMDDLSAALRPHGGYQPVRDLLERLGQARRSRMFLLADIIAPAGG